MRSRRSQWVDHAPLGLLLLSPLAMAVAVILLPPPDAHWSDHGRYAAAAGGCLAAIAIGACLVRGRLTVAPILILGALAAGLGLQAIGSTTVARSIWRQPWDGDEVARFAGSLDAFVRGHQLADRANDVILVAGLALAVYAGARRWVPVEPAFLGGVLALLPPRILPGVGAVFLLAWTAVHQRRSAGTPSQAEPVAAPGPSTTRGGG